MIPALLPPGAYRIPIGTCHPVGHRVAQILGDGQGVFLAVYRSGVDGGAKRFEFRQVLFIAG